MTNPKHEHENITMSDYSILIRGSGPCGTGDESSADLRVLDFMKKLQESGHTFSAVSLQVDGVMLPILGGVSEHPLIEATPVETVTLGQVLEAVSAVHSDLKKFASYEKREDKKKEGGGKKKETPPAPVKPEIEEQAPVVVDAATAQPGETEPDAPAAPEVPSPPPEEPTTEPEA